MIIQNNALFCVEQEQKMIKNLGQLFTEHPASVHETYSEHLVMASGFGFKMMVAGFACVLHGLFPFLFIKTGSKAINELHDTMVTNRQRHRVWAEICTVSPQTSEGSPARAQYIDAGVSI